MLILPKLCYKSTFLHCSNILIEIPCKNVQFFTLVHAESVPNFLFLLFLLFFLLSYPRSFLLFTSFFLAGKVWTKSSVYPEKGTLINYRCVGLFMHRFGTKNAACFFFRLAPSDRIRYTKCMVLWKNQSTLYQLLISKVD